ncbi:hypothetical protein AVEN_240180-1 [Araneus ventricosus]|uniref:Uncharacterized protein n=1 Tax=Araneus ventricosus TaxID=182803 RepID=A0A4Y2PKF7_ARAVE|nr:hypothetical protein AVEN_240180-1 [Araneus ventricosus]
MDKTRLVSERPSIWNRRPKHETGELNGSHNDPRARKPDVNGAKPERLEDSPTLLMVDLKTNEIILHIYRPASLLSHVQNKY